MTERVALDFLGDEMPQGYEPWSCDVCTAVCNFEAMTMCAKTEDCGFDRDFPESNGGAFGFMLRADGEKEPEPMTERDKDNGRWICPHGFETGFFPVPGQPHLIEHRSCGICCDEISEKLIDAGLGLGEAEDKS